MANSLFLCLLPWPLWQLFCFACFFKSHELLLFLLLNSSFAYNSPVDATRLPDVDAHLSVNRVFCWARLPKQLDCCIICCFEIVLDSLYSCLHIYINHIGPRGSHDTKVASAFRSYATVVASATPLWRAKRICLSLYRPVRAN